MRKSSCTNPKTLLREPASPQKSPTHAAFESARRLEPANINDPVAQAPRPAQAAPPASSASDSSPCAWLPGWEVRTGPAGPGLAARSGPARPRRPGLAARRDSSRSGHVVVYCLRQRQRGPPRCSRDDNRTGRVAHPGPPATAAGRAALLMPPRARGGGGCDDRAGLGAVAVAASARGGGGRS